MILQEQHKQFAVKCFAQFMTRAQVDNAFIEELQDELPKPTHRMACREGASPLHITQLIN